jgi:membrane protein implicated in regulation of membrane protease activity
MRPRTILAILSAVNALIAVLLAIAVNVATSAVPDVLRQHPGWAWMLVVVLAIASIACAVAAVRVQDASDQSPSPQYRVGGLHVGEDLKIRGRGHDVVGGNKVSITSSPKRSKRRRG